MPDVASLLPPNATAQESALEQSTARVGAVPTPVREMWTPATCPSDLLPWMAWAFSVDFWDSTWTDEQKRTAIAAAPAVQKIKGTIGAVKQALAALGFGVTVQEWFNQTPAGSPYTYRLLVDASQVGIDQDGYTKVVSYVDATKNLRSHLSDISPSVTTQATLTVASAASMGNEITVGYGGGGLYADGTAVADGTYAANGIKAPA